VEAALGRLERLLEHVVVDAVLVAHRVEDVAQDGQLARSRYVQLPLSSPPRPPSPHPSMQVRPSPRQRGTEGGGEYYLAMVQVQEKEEHRRHQANRNNPRLHCFYR
jgi:hypothetical protein